MLLIPDDATLRRFIPNTFAKTFPEQESLYDKMLPRLTAAELWLTENIIPHEILHRLVDEALSTEDPLYFVPRSIVALKAWADAIPSLDVVVSDSGISTVETNTLRPASKAKIDRLIESSQRQLDAAIAMLPKLLMEVPGWWQTPQAEPFRRTLFHDYTILTQIKDSPKGPVSEPPGETCRTVHDRFLSILPRIEAIEDELAQYWVSAPIMRRLRETKGQTHAETKLRELVRTAIIATANGAGPQEKKQMCRRLTDHILTHAGDFPQWRGTSTAALFSVPAYRNRPGSTAHWL
ncbi:MAG: hypothetical protein NC039_09135 [Muribaculaceae bacterium]|nr:hypothetical protein [Muribaculaceae bacterium]